MTRFYLVFDQFDQILPFIIGFWFWDMSPELEKWLKKNSDLQNLQYFFPNFLFYFNGSFPKTNFYG